MSYEGVDARRSRPLVAGVCVVPLIGEAVAAALEFADVRSFDAQRDTPGLLGSLKPDAVVVDNPEDAAAAAEFARGKALPVVEVSIRDLSLKLIRAGSWHEVGDGDGPTPEAIRNVVAGSLFAGAGR